MKTLDSIENRITEVMRGRSVVEETTGVPTNADVAEVDATQTEKPALSFMDKNAESISRDENGQLKTYKDKEALDDFLAYEKEIVLTYPAQDWVEGKVKKIKDYVEKGLYRDETLLPYSPSSIDSLLELLYITYKQNDRGDTTFYSAALFTNSYAMRMGRKTLIKTYGFKESQLPKNFIDGNIILEDKADRAVATALYTAKGDVTTAKDIVKHMAKRTFHPATPTYINSAKKRSGEATSCYIFALEDDIDSISYAHEVALQKSKRGGGIGYDLSNIRALGETIKGVENRAKGVIPVAKLIEGAVGYADQDGARPGSAVANLSVFHPDIEDFLNSKKENAEENIRLKNLSTAVIVYNKFFELLEAGEDFYTFYPRTVFEATGKNFTEIDFSKEYDSLVANPKVKKKKFNAREIMSLIARLHGMRGYPYIIHYDNTNKVHHFKNVPGYTVKCSNLC